MNAILIPLEASMPQNILQIVAKYAGLDETPLGKLLYKTKLNDLDKVILVAELTDRGFRSVLNNGDFYQAVRHG